MPPKYQGCIETEKRERKRIEHGYRKAKVKMNTKYTDNSKKTYRQT